MDKLQAWLRRIQQPPRREVANLEYWFLLAETRIAQEAGMPPERSAEDGDTNLNLNLYNHAASFPPYRR